MSLVIWHGDTQFEFFMKNIASGSNRYIFAIALGWLTLSIDN